MTASVQNSFLSSEFTSTVRYNNNRCGSYAEKLYQVEITDFDGDMQFLEVCAHSISEAAEIAENISTCDIYMMNVYEHIN